MWCRSRSQPIVIIQKEGDIKKPPAVAFTCPAFAWKFRANFSAINRTAASDLETPPTCILPTTNYQAATCLPLPTPTYLEASTILARKPVAAHLHGGLIKTVCGWVDGWLAWLGVFVRTYVRWFFRSLVVLAISYTASLSLANFSLSRTHNTHTFALFMRKIRGTSAGSHLVSGKIYSLII